MRAGAFPFAAIPAGALSENSYPAWGPYVTVLVILPATLVLSAIKGALSFVAHIGSLTITEDL